MVSRPGRRRALELLDETGLACEVLPDVAAASGDAAGKTAWLQAARIIEAHDEPDLGTALAAIYERVGPDTLRAAGARLRLSNRDVKLASWLLDAVAAIGRTDGLAVQHRPWSEVQPWLAHDDAFLLADLLRARAACGRGRPAAAAWVTEQVRRPREQLDPPPLLSGNDLMTAGVPEGKVVGLLLAALRAKQLDGEITTRGQAEQWVARQREA
jgi:hypothetical protein